MKLSFASYNIHKGVGADRRFDPGRILDVLDEVDADIVGLQEVDRRFGQRASIFRQSELEARGWQIASVPLKPASMGWHGNLVLVRAALSVTRVETVQLPQIEQRGALQVEIEHAGRAMSVTAMHLDLSGLRRKSQLATVCRSSRATGLPAVMLGDLNEWSVAGGGLRGLAEQWAVITPGRSFPARKPFFSLDRIIHSPHWQSDHATVHDSPLARQASDHLPIRAQLQLTA